MLNLSFLGALITPLFILASIACVFTLHAFRSTEGGGWPTFLRQWGTHVLLVWLTIMVVSMLVWCGHALLVSFSLHSVSLDSIIMAIGGKTYYVSAVAIVITALLAPAVLQVLEDWKVGCLLNRGRHWDYALMIGVGVVLVFCSALPVLLLAIAALGLLTQSLARFPTLRKGFALMAGALLAVFVLVVVPIAGLVGGAIVVQSIQADQQARVAAKYQQRANDDIADIHQQKLQSCIALHPSQQSQCEPVQNRYVEACQRWEAGNLPKQMQREMCERRFNPYDPAQQMQQMGLE